MGVTIKNVGSAPAQTIAYSYFLSSSPTVSPSDVQIGQGSVSSLAAGATFTRPSATLPASLPAGSYTVRRDREPRKLVTEYSYSNNSAVATPPIQVSAGALAITTTAAPPASVGAPYQTLLVASGGGGIYSWTIASGTLPAGLALAADGTVSGTPSTAGDDPVTVKVADQNAASATAMLDFKVSAQPLPLAVLTNSLPGGSFGVAYSLPLVAIGGAPPYQWSIVSGSSPPPGIAISADGTLAGAPAADGAFVFQVQVQGLGERHRPIGSPRPAGPHAGPRGCCRGAAAFRHRGLDLPGRAPRLGRHAALQLGAGRQSAAPERPRNPGAGPEGLDARRALARSRAAPLGDRHRHRQLRAHRCRSTDWTAASAASGRGTSCDTVVLHDTPGLRADHSQPDCPRCHRGPGLTRRPSPPTPPASGDFQRGRWLGCAGEPGDATSQAALPLPPGVDPRRDRPALRDARQLRRHRLEQDLRLLGARSDGQGGVAIAAAASPDRGSLAVRQERRLRHAPEGPRFSQPRGVGARPARRNEEQ